MTEVDWENLCELDAERTQGEWFYYPVAPARGAGTTEFDFKYGDSISGLSSRTPVGDRHITEFGEASPQKDARFIAAVANAFPAIKAERDEQAATIRALQEDLAEYERFRDMIILHSENQDMSHLDFRVHAGKHALTLKDATNAEIITATGDASKSNRDDAKKAVLARLAATDIEAMTESEYGDWINALPRDEFIALMLMCIPDGADTGEQANG